jgi:phosphosulfolactate synthase (CoM biosynthesis protein A)
LYIINNNPPEARDYLMRAHAIFESKGLLKLLKEVKSKLKMLNSSVKLAAEVVAAEAIESGGDDSGKEGSPDKRSPINDKGIGKMKKKKVMKKKPKKTVFRNNFVKEGSDSN